MKHLWLWLVLSGAASADESADVRRAVEHFLDLLGGLRHYALEQYFTPDANITTARSMTSGFVHRTMTAREWIGELQELPATRPFREILSNVDVRVENNELAFVRANFEIVREEGVASSGVDYFTLVRREGKWKIASIAYTSIPSTAATTPDSPLTRELTGMLDALDAKSSLYAKHLPTGREIEIRADEPMNTLSVIKVPILVLAYQDAESGKLDLDERTLIRPEDRRRGSGLLQTFAPGLSPTYRDLATQMIVTSDNSATDILIEKLGLDRVNALLGGQGYRETRLLRTTGELFRRVWELQDPENATLSAAEVFEKGFPQDAGAFERSFGFEGTPDEWLGRTTARETGRLLEQILDGKLASRESSDEMIAILKRQFYSSRIPRHLRGIEVAHKTGDWPPIAGNDVGILFHPGGPTVLSIFVNQNRGDFVKVEETHGEIARKLVGAWSK